MNNAWRIFGVISAFIFVFLAGAVIGGSGMVLLTRGRFQQFQQQRSMERTERQRQEQQGVQEQRQLVQVIDSLRQQIQQLQNQRPGGRHPPLSPEQFGPQLMQRFVNQIQPTPEQREQIRPMVFQAAEELRRQSRDHAHSAQVVIEHLEDQISGILTPAQRNRFNDMITRQRAAFQRFNQQMQEFRAQQRFQQQQQWQHRGWQQQPGQQPANLPPPANGVPGQLSGAPAPAAPSPTVPSPAAPSTTAPAPAAP